jgi:hypothetical protein
MSQKIFFILIACSLFSSPVLAKVVKGSPAIVFKKKIEKQVSEVVTKCTAKGDKDFKFSGHDDFSFKIGSDGNMTDFTYHSSSEKTPPSWLTCLKEELNLTEWEKPPGKGAYLYKGSFNWDESTSSQSKTDSPDDLAVTRSLSKDFQGCYAKYLERGGTKQGQLVLRWTIAHNGKAFNLRTDKDDFGDTRLPECLKDIVNKAQYPKTNEEKDITLPLVFSKN